MLEWSASWQIYNTTGPKGIALPLAKLVQHWHSTAVSLVWSPVSACGVTMVTKSDMVFCFSRSPIYIWVFSTIYRPHISTERWCIQMVRQWKLSTLWVIMPVCTRSYFGKQKIFKQVHWAPQEADNVVDTHQQIREQYLHLLRLVVHNALFLQIFHTRHLQSPEEIHLFIQLNLWHVYGKKLQVTSWIWTQTNHRKENILQIRFVFTSSCEIATRWLQQPKTTGA